MGDFNYAIRLGGICMDPDFKVEQVQLGSVTFTIHTICRRSYSLQNLTNPNPELEKPAIPKPERVKKLIDKRMLARQGHYALAAVVDNVINLNDPRKSTLPFG